MDNKIDSLIIINEMLMTCMSEMSHKDQLGKILKIILSTPWFNLKNKGAIFLAAENEESLTLTAQQNFSLPHYNRCKKIKYNECVCGMAMHARGVIFVRDCDVLHSIKIEDASPHAHYCMALRWKERIVGVLNLYVSADHEVCEDEKTFLQSITYILAEIIQHRNQEKKVRRLAEFDTLTGLPNRDSFQRRLAHALAVAERTKTEVALMFVDLDRFKEVNDLFGHAAGDQLLIQVGKRLQTCVRNADIVARLGGDEFTVILWNVVDYHLVSYVAMRILYVLNSPFTIGEIDVKISGSIGIAFYPSDATCVEGLVKAAGTAMYDAKQSGRAMFRFKNAAKNEEHTQMMLEFHDKISEVTGSRCK